MWRSSGWTPRRGTLGSSTASAARRPLTGLSAAVCRHSLLPPACAKCAGCLLFWFYRRFSGLKNNVWSFFLSLSQASVWQEYSSHSANIFSAFPKVVTSSISDEYEACNVMLRLSTLVFPQYLCPRRNRCDSIQSCFPPQDLDLRGGGDAAAGPWPPGGCRH